MFHKNKFSVLIALPFCLKMREVSKVMQHFIMPPCFAWNSHKKHTSVTTINELKIYQTLFITPVALLLKCPSDIQADICPASLGDK